MFFIARREQPPPGMEDDKDEDGDRVGLTQWAEIGGNYVGSTETMPVIPPGVYDIHSFQGGYYFSPLDERDDDLIRFPGTRIDDVVNEIETFWTQENAFRAHGLPYKRGILLYGPPGSGKSSTLRFITNDVVAKGGIVLTYSGPDSFISGYRILRTIQPTTPIVVLMEDLDSILKMYSQSAILNLLDGVESVDKVVFLATTNYPGDLKARISNRPSRFDRVYAIPHPNEAGRRLYLESLIRHGDEVDVDQYVKDTGGMSLAHLKELFVATVILGNPYGETLKTLRAMRNPPSAVDVDGEMGEGESHQPPAGWL